MTVCDFSPPDQLALAPPASATTKREWTQRTVPLRASHIRVEPIQGARWMAWTHAPNDQWTTKATALTPRDAIHALCPEAVWPDAYPHPCVACGNEHGLILDSPPGTVALRWYCPACDPPTPTATRTTGH